MDLKKLLFPKQRYIESLIKRYAIFSDNEKNVRIAPIRSIFHKEKLSMLSEGIQARIFKHKDYSWVIKEGKWDLQLELFGTGKIPINAILAEKVMNFFSFTFRPHLKEVLRQYNLYLTFSKYFGYFEKKDSFYHPQIESLLTEQRHIRNSMLYYKPELEKHFNFKINPKIDSILLSENRFHNFLPKEYLLYGPSISTENANNLTYYIIQEFIEGVNLDKLDETNLQPKSTEQIILLLYLILLLDYQKGLLPDTRPKYLISQMYNWLLKTDNIKITKDNDVKFIDTRWLWNRNDNFIKRGLIIPEIIENLAKGYINFLLDSLSI